MEMSGGCDNVLSAAVSSDSLKRAYNIKQEFDRITAARTHAHTQTHPTSEFPLGSGKSTKRRHTQVTILTFFSGDRVDDSHSATFSRILSTSLHCLPVTRLYWPLFRL